MSNIFRLARDHPGFPGRVTLAVETWLSFAWAGAGHGLYTIAWAAFLPSEETIAASSIHKCLALVVTAAGAWVSLSPAVARDFRLHYRYTPSRSQLFHLELFRLVGFFLARTLLSHHAFKFRAPLIWILRDPPLVVSFVYQFMVLWAVWNIMPEIVVISSRGFTLPKFTARMIGTAIEAARQVQQATIADVILRSRFGDDTERCLEYRYQPILTPRTIRLLRLESSQGNISCRLEIAKLDQAPAFWAVSYLWGSEDKPISLIISDVNSKYIGDIAITQNCAAAIQSLAPNSVRYLWVDAVCINQSDISEKQLQIPLMGEIYSQASLVAGHLHSDSAFSVGLLVHRIIQAVGNGKRFDMSWAAPAQVFRAASALFQHQYFERVWITQEIVLAKSICLIYGKDVIYLDHLMEISRGQSLDLIDQPQSIVLPVLTRSGEQWMKNEWMNLVMSISSFRERATVIDRLRTCLGHEDKSKRLTVAQIVDSNLSRGAKNPRDQVYAMLSLASDSTIPALQPNYSKLVSDKEIFTKISWHYLQDGKHLHLFLNAGIASKTVSPRMTSPENPERTQDLPSWAYDFATGPAREFNLGNWAVAIDRTRSCGLKCRISAEMNQLSVHGTIIDVVAFIAPQFEFRVEQGAFAAPTAEDMSRLVTSTVEHTRSVTQNHAPITYPTGIPRDEAYWRTMFMDRFGGQTPAPPGAEAVFNMFLEFAPQLITGQKPRGNIPGVLQGVSGVQATEAIRSMIEAATRVWMPYVFVVTKQGYMGWAPHGTEPGDVFCIFDGCIVPFVLRPQSSGTKFTLQSDGYIHGFLPGQPGLQNNSKEWLNLV